MKICKVKGCENKHYAKRLCHKHYDQLRRHGKILKRTVKDKNEIIDCENYYEIILYSGRKNQKEKARVKIDKEDIKKVRNYKWCLSSEYPKNSNKGFLHQLILGKKDGLVIDHINHDKLDARKQNLRHCAHCQNLRNNKSKGITWNKERKKWVAQICINYKGIGLGYFVNKQEAITARRNAEIKYFKEFAYKSS